MDIYGHLIPVMHEGFGNKMDEWLTPISVDLGEKADITQPIRHNERK
jgi:hypothetical protein